MLKVYLHDRSMVYMNHYKEAIYARKEQNTKQETTYLQIRLCKILFTLLLKRFLRQMAVIMNLCIFIINPLKLNLQQHILDGLLLIVAGVVSGALSKITGGSHVQDFVSGILMALSVAELLAGILFIVKYMTKR